MENKTRYYSKPCGRCGKPLEMDGHICHSPAEVKEKCPFQIGTFGCSCGDCYKKIIKSAELNLASQSSLEEMYVKMKPLVEKMKAKYPKDCNIEGLEPALTNDITEIVLQEYKADIKNLIKNYKRHYNEDLNCNCQDDLINLIISPNKE
jgi:hypothetical protein